MQKNTLEFIKDNCISTIACVDSDGSPYCFNCFYTFEPEIFTIVFATAPTGTKHSEMLEKNVKVAGTILPSIEAIGSVRGLQFTGRLVEEVSLSEDVKNSYRNRYLHSTGIPHILWGVKMDFTKLTDNTIAFGYKEIWSE